MQRGDVCSAFAVPLLAAQPPDQRVVGQHLERHDSQVSPGRSPRPVTRPAPPHGQSDGRAKHDVGEQQRFTLVSPHVRRQATGNLVDQQGQQENGRCPRVQESFLQMPPSSLQREKQTEHQAAGQ